MKRMRVRGGQAVAAATAGALLAGCAFAVVPPKKHAAASPTASLRDPYGYRLADAPALLTQCAVDTAGLRPGTGLDWFSNGQVTVNTTNADNFASWWSTHKGPGPYPQIFVIGGRRTHYLEFGPTWVKSGSLWVPAHVSNKTLGHGLLADRLDRVGRGQRQAAPGGLRDVADRAPAPGGDLRPRDPQPLVIT